MWVWVERLCLGMFDRADRTSTANRVSLSDSVITGTPVTKGAPGTSAILLAIEWWLLFSDSDSDPESV